MHIALALLSALFSAFTAIFGKKALKGIDSHAATFIRTGLILVYVWVFAFAVGAHKQISALQAESVLFLLLSGAATGGSWLCYYKALSIGEVTRVTAVDKSSILLTMVFGMTVLQEHVSAGKVIGLVLIAAGTFLMLGKFSKHGGTNTQSLLLALASAILAALTSILAKIGLREVDANLGTAIRTAIVFVFAGLMLLPKSRRAALRTVKRNTLGLLGLSALATSLAWLCYFNALRMGEASIVAPLDKLSTVITIGLSIWLLKEKASASLLAGAGIATVGTILTLF